MLLILVCLVSGQKPSSVAFNNNMPTFSYNARSNQDVGMYPCIIYQMIPGAHMWLVMSINSHGQKVTDLRFDPKSFKSKTSSPFINLQPAGRFCWKDKIQMSILQQFYLSVFFNLPRGMISFYQHSAYCWLQIYLLKVQWYLIVVFVLLNELNTHTLWIELVHIS